MLLYLPGLVIGVICLLLATRLREQERTREAGMLMGLAIVLLLTSIAAAGLSIAGVF